MLALEVMRRVVRVRPRGLFDKLLPRRAESLDEGREAGGVLGAEGGQLGRGLPRYWLAEGLIAPSV